MLTRRLKMIRIDVPSLLENIARAPEWTPHLQVRGLPDDVRVVSLHVDPRHPGHLCVLVSSETFPELPEPVPVPETYVDFVAWCCEELAQRRQLGVMNT